MSDKKNETTYCLYTPDAIIEAVVRNEHIIRCPPDIYWMAGKTPAYVQQWAASRGYVFKRKYDA